MSKDASTFLEIIKKEYQNRLVEGKSEGCNAFENKFFIEKYHYSKERLDKIIDELNDLGYIEKWIMDAFAYLVD